MPPSSFRLGLQHHQKLERQDLEFDSVAQPFAAALAFVGHASAAFASVGIDFVGTGSVGTGSVGGIDSVDGIADCYAED